MSGLGVGVGAGVEPPPEGPVGDEAPEPQPWRRSRRAAATLAGGFAVEKRIIWKKQARRTTETRAPTTTVHYTNKRTVGDAVPGQEGSPLARIIHEEVN